MDDNSLSDDEVKESPLSPVMGGKKLKLNDGSSQDSSNGSASSSKVVKDENVDSGVSADKSESTSSEERAAEPLEGPSNVVVNAAPSSSIHGIVLNIRRPRLGRCYRKRKTPDRDSDSDSSRDSDDLSTEESPPVSRRLSNNSDGESVDLERSLGAFSEVSRSPSSNSNHSSSNESSYGQSSELNLINSDSDSDDGNLWQRSDIDQEDKAKMDSVLSKTRPKHSYFILREILNREMGLTLPSGKTTKEDVMFERRFYGSLHAVYRLQKLHHLNKHKGCVNSINFHPEGQLLASGSDDTNVVVWDWARQAALQTIKTGHKSNVFQSKFLHLNARSQLNIVTCARDGQVRLLQCPPSGGATVSRRRLASHSRAAHKLHVSAHAPHLVVSGGEDGVVLQCDVRAEQANKLFHVKEAGSSIPLYSVSGHPLEPRLLCVAGRDRFVRVYDTRHAARARDLYCPNSFQDHETDGKKKFKYNMMHLTCAIYNHDGSEILGSYNDEDIYLFDSIRDVYDKDNPNKETNGYTHKYSGHRNSATFKGVAFFGPKSQYVVSGSDCSHIYIWEKETEAIVQWMEGDIGGVVNCIETHPRSPVLASSGLDKDVKIWVPSSQEEPTYAGLEKIVRENSTTPRSPLFSDFLPTLYSAWRGENRVFTDEDRAPPYGGNIEFDGNVCTAF
ncbi:DDB1- and CUL4-associated factor 8 [Cydia fagiglandana]|uniref:DDB1- and CUL4-associated factor 8 n=1 Tax=Cydia fagiglandana TaxID=1458189 RepID=UPI002FEDF3B7